MKQRFTCCICYKDCKAAYAVLSRTEESSMEFIEIGIYCSVLLVGRWYLFFFEGKQSFDTTSGWHD